MIKKISVLVIAFIMAILMVPIHTVFPVNATKGPRSDVDILFYESQASAYAALKIGEVDFIQGSLTYEQRLNAEDDPDLCVAAYSENGMYEFDLNNNYTIKTYPGARNPLHVKEFRRALSCMVNKTYIIAEILGDAASLLNVPISVNSYSWWPTCAYPEDYQWKYNMTKAEELLMAAGFVDTDVDNIVNYPTDWPGRPGQPNMDPLIFYVRTEDERLEAGRYFYNQLNTFGIPCNKIEMSFQPFPWDPVFDDHNYHIYTGGWVLGRYPTILYYAYSCGYPFPIGGPNYVTGMNSSNLPNYPDYDELAHEIVYTDSIESARTAAKAAAELGWCDYVFNIPLWSRKYFVAWSATMAGVVNMVGYGLDNRYQFMNAYKVGGGPITMGTISAPKSLNPLYSQWIYDYAVLDRVYDSLLYYNPYDLGIDQPWAAQDWEVGTWIDPDPGAGEPSEKIKVTYYLRKDVGVIAPNGTFIRNLNAYDLEFSCWYTYAFDDGWNWANYQDVHHTNVVDDYTIEYYFDDSWFWIYTAPQYPILGKTELVNKLCNVSSVSFASDGANCTADTQFKLSTTDQIVQVVGTSGLVEGVDFAVFGGYEDYEHNWIWILRNLPAGTYTINYYTPDLDPHGYYLAGLDWTETWYSAGPFYPTEIVPSVSGHASFIKNPYYWMETPPLGETDWRWIWETPGGVPGPENPGCDSGYFKIEIYDVVKATASYCHRGSGPYDPHYFPGGDLDASDLGHVGIYDVVSITGQYGYKWGTPPDR